MNEQEMHDQNMRDLFAALALNGMMNKALEMGYSETKVAKTAYLMADAMMEQREQRKEADRE